MRATSATFRSLVQSSHQMVSRARLVTPGQTGTNPGPLDEDGKPLYELPIEDGDVRLDPSAQIRSTVNLSTIYPWPDDEANPLAIYGEMELFVERGVAYGNGVREWVGLGYYRLDELGQEDAPDGPIDVEAPDRMAQIIDDRLEEPRQFLATDTIRFVVESLVEDVYPSAVISIEGFDPDVPIGSMQIVERERYPFLLEIAKANGCTMFFDYDGRFRMAPMPSPSSMPVWNITHGRGGVLVKLSRRLSRRSIFNAVVAEGEQLSDLPPVRGVARDTSTSSRTRWGGPFGKVPKFFVSTFLKTSDQAARAAEAILARTVGVPYTINFGFVPNPALEPLDVVGVAFSDRVGIQRHILDTLIIPLTARGLMTATTRLQPEELI